MRILTLSLLVLLALWHGAACLMHLYGGAWYTGVTYELFTPMAMWDGELDAINMAYSHPWVGPLQLVLAALRAIAGLAVLAATVAVVRRRRGAALTLLLVTLVPHLTYAPLALFVLWTLELAYGSAFLDRWIPIVGIDLAIELQVIRHAWVPWIAASLLTSPVAAALAWFTAAPVPDATSP